jgi:Na+/H+-dicarboxylate symporter
MFKLALHWQIAIGMLLGAAIGLTANWTLGSRTTEIVRKAIAETDSKEEREAKQKENQKLPEGVDAMTIVDTVNRITIDVRFADPEQGTKKYVVDGTEPPSKAFATLDQLAKQLEEQGQSKVYAAFVAHGRSWARWLGDGANALGGLFLRLLQMVAVPLIVFSLMSGVLGLGQADRLGRMFGRTILYYLVTSLLAIFTGLLMVNLIQPGLKPGLNKEGGDVPEVSGDLGGVLFEQLKTMIPSNPVAALAEGNFLSIICFTLVFAIFAVLVGGRTVELFKDLANAGFDVMMKLTMAIIRLAPVGVFFLMIYVTATQGLAVFGSLAWYMLTVFLALVFHAFVTLPLILWLVARRSPLEYIRALSPALLTAFSSASSNATLPLTMTCVENRAGVSNRVSSFVLPLGATVNMDGTALYEAVAVLFISQLYRGEMLSFDQQFVVALTALLASIGAAGIPHAGLVMMVIILQAVGLPLEMQGIIIAVDRVLDMCRTSVNVWSDACGCAVVSRFEAAHGKAAEPDLAEESMEFQP